MASPSADPTPITPPRVPFFDERSGLISREWYMFFLSLFRGVQTGDDWNKGLAASDSSAQINAAIQTAQLAAQMNATQAELAALRAVVQGLELAPPRREFKRSRYGQFLDTTTQTATAINTPKAITFNTTDVTSGVYLGSPTSRIIVDTEGVYNVIFSIQLDKTSGGTGIFWVWPRINGVDVPDSNSQVQIQGNNAEQLVTIGYFFKMKANDYLEMMFAVNDVSVEMTAFPASAFYPSIPSIILTVSNNIQGVQ